MPIRCDEYNQVCVVSVEGDLSGDACVAMRKLVDDRINIKHIVEFVLDMEKCPFIDSEGLETMVWAKKRSEDLFGQIKVVGLDDNCRKILELTRLAHRFECDKDLAAALKNMS